MGPDVLITLPFGLITLPMGPAVRITLPFGLITLPMGPAVLITLPFRLLRYGIESEKLRPPPLLLQK